MWATGSSPLGRRRQKFGTSSAFSAVAQEVCYFSEQCVDDRFGVTLGRFRCAAQLFLAVYTFELGSLRSQRRERVTALQVGELKQI